MFSSKCNRTKVKTRKRVSVSLRCPHEVIVAVCTEDNLPLPQSKESVEVECKYCRKRFDITSGGRCECKRGVYYCSKKCQVNVSSKWPQIWPNIVYFKEDGWDLHRLECGLTQRYLRNTAEYLLDTSQLPDKSILQIVSTYDAAETLKLPGKWPRSYSCVENVCPIHESFQTSKLVVPVYSSKIPLNCIFVPFSVILHHLWSLKIKMLKKI